MNLFEGVDPEQVTVSHVRGEILNVSSNTNDQFISLFSLDYPCVCCHTAVTTNYDKTGNSLRCTQCRLYWHNECGGPDYLIPIKLVKELKDAPPNVGPHTRMGYLQIAHSCFTADSQSRLKDASGE